MFVYYLDIDVKIGADTCHDGGVYSSLEKAKNIGKDKLKKIVLNLYDLYKLKKDKIDFEQIINIDRCNYEFTITEVDPEIADNFEETDNYLKEEPTHKKYVFNYNAELKYIDIIYKYKQEKIIDTIQVTQEDTLLGAGTKFKIGDLVKRTAESFKEKIYVVAEVPKREKGQKYFDNTYLVVNAYENGLIYHKFKENEITSFAEKLDESSKMAILQKIIKKEITVNDEELKQIKAGKINLLNYLKK